MTIIGTTSFGRGGLLFADVLITAPGAEIPHAYSGLPTIVDLPAILPAEYLFPVTRLQQKLELINDRFAVAWAGSDIAARTVVHDILKAFADRPPKPDELRVLLSEHGSGLQCELVGRVLVEEQGYGFHWTSAVPRELSVGDTFLAGSGVHRTTSLSRAGRAISSNVNPMLAAIGFVGQLVADEVRTGASVLEGFGGGYQILAQDGGALIAPESITFMFLTADLSVNTDAPARMSKNFIKYGHVDRLPYCARIGGANSAKEVYVYRLAPTISTDETRARGDAAFKRLSVADISIESSYYCISLDAALPGMPGQRGRIVHVVDVNTHEVSVRREGKIEQLSVKGSVFKEMRDALLRNLA